MGCGSSSTSVKNFESSNGYYNDQKQSNASEKVVQTTATVNKQQDFTRTKSPAPSNHIRDNIKINGKLPSNSSENITDYCASTVSTSQSQTSVSDQYNAITVLDKVGDTSDNEQIETETSVEHFDEDNAIESDILRDLSEDDALNQGYKANSSQEKWKPNAIQMIQFPKQKVRSWAVLFSFESLQNVTNPIRQPDRHTQHEQRAKEIEETRNTINYELENEKIHNELGLVPLIIPKVAQKQQLSDYTVDDILEHYPEWFKYGRKVYNFETMWSIIKNRVNQYMHMRQIDTLEERIQPRYIMRDEYGVTRTELKNVLSVCIIGNYVELEHDQFLFRMKNEIETIIESLDNDIEDLPETDNVLDIRNQLNRWLSEYPLNPTKNKPPDASSDANQVHFPLPADIRANPSLLRKWIETWETFETDVQEEGVWAMLEYTGENINDAHEVFAELVSTGHDDSTLEPFDMTIEGNVAWTEIEQELFEKDVTTEEQDLIRKAREAISNITDLKWMENRRKAIGHSLTVRHQWDAEKVEPYLSFSDNLVSHWKSFQELCGQD